MIKCRKIYGNLLLLSVLLFALGASAAPRINLGTGRVLAWRNAAENVEFRWECGCGEIVYRGQQLVTMLLFFGNKAVEVKGVLPNGFGDVKPGVLIQFQLPGGISGNAAAVAHPAAVNDRKARLQKSYRAGNIIDHGKPPDYFS